MHHFFARMTAQQIVGQIGRGAQSQDENQDQHAVDLESQSEHAPS
jgi:hypothetical protein